MITYLIHVRFKVTKISNKINTNKHENITLRSVDAKVASELTDILL